MPMVEFSDSDLLRNKIVSPGWYLLKLSEFTEWTPSADGMSNNSKCEATIIRNDENGDTEFAGVPIAMQFNDKKGARGFIEGFLRALAVDVIPGRYDLAQSNGMTISAYVENDTYQGRILNRINHKYRTVKK